MIKKIKKDIPFLSLPIILYMILGPLEIFAGNQDEFIFGSNCFIFIFLGISLVILILGLLILAFIPEKIKKFINTLIFAIGLMSYIQNMFLNPSLMNVDGSGVDWNGLRTEAIINIVIWIVVTILLFVALIIFKDKFIKIMRYASIALSIMVSVASVSLLFTSKFNIDLENRYALSPEEQFVLGSEENVIVLVLDKYSNSQFEMYMDEKKAAPECLKDFTYYDNMNSRYAYTSPSFTYMFTGLENIHEYMILDEYKDTDAYQELAWNSDKARKYYDTLRENGYGCYLYTITYEHLARDPKLLEGVYDNCKPMKINVDYGLLCRLLTKMSVYKYVPTLAKPGFEVFTYSFTGVISYDNDYVPAHYTNDVYAALMNDGLSVDSKIAKKMQIQHLRGVHDPFCIDLYSDKVSEVNSKEDCLIAQENMIIALDEYMKQLKELGLYDSSSIIITSDHGLKYDAYDPQPIFFIKPAGQTQDAMTTTLAPITSEDLMPTIMQLCHIEYSAYGTSVYDWSDEDKRERICSYPETGYAPVSYIGDRYDLIKLMKNEIVSGK